MKNIIHGYNEIMIVLMKCFGINKDADLSPFYENLKTVSYMLEAYILIIVPEHLNMKLMIHQKNKIFTLGYMIL